MGKSHRGYRRARVITPLLLGLIYLAFPMGTSLAMHSLPSGNLWYWDLGNDGDPDPAVPVDAAGGDWTTLALDRLNAGISEWASDTQFDPFYVSSGSQQVYRDGTAPCGEPGATFEVEDLAATCIYSTYKRDPRYVHDVFYFDISGADTYFNPNLAHSQRWWFLTTHSAETLDVDFQGVLTHELGHWARLVDLYGTNCNYGTGMYTMCGAPQIPAQFPNTTVADDTWRARSLTSDDISAANAVY